MSLLVGYEAEVGKEARIPPFHLILTGITQHGKTEEIKRLVTEAQKLGYTILILDVKGKPEGEKGDFEGFGWHVPIYLAGIADTLSMYGLLESHSNMKLRKELPELARACKRGKTIKGAYEILKEMYEEKERKLHPYTKDRIEILLLVLGPLIEEMDKAQPTSKLLLKKGKINVMALRDQSSGFKQLAVNDATAYIRRYFRKTIEVFDEAHQQIPQSYGSGSKKTVTAAIKEGAGSQQFIWIADQTIKEVDKDVIAQIPFKIYGGQAIKLRAKETVEHLSVKRWRGKKINEEFIMQLKTGFFVLGERDRTRLVYTLPIWMPDFICRQVALGNFEPKAAKNIANFYSGFYGTVPRITVRPDKIAESRWRNQFEDLKKATEKAIAELEAEKQRLEKEVAEFEGKWDEATKIEKAVILEKEGEIKDLTNQLDVARKNHDIVLKQIHEFEERSKAAFSEMSDLTKQLAAAQKKLEGYEKFADSLAGILQGRSFIPSDRSPNRLIPGPSAIIVTDEQPPLEIDKLRKPLIQSTDDLTGRIAVLYAEGLLPKTAFSLSKLNNALDRRFGKREANPQLSAVCTNLVRWGYFEKVQSGKRTDYKIRMDPKEAKKKGLLKIREKIVE